VRSHFGRWGAVYILASLFLLSWTGHAVLEWLSYTQEQDDHGIPATASGYWVEFGRATLENWQSEWLQLLGEALLFLGPLAALLWKADQQSKESHDIKVQMAELHDEVLLLREHLTTKPPSP
jgi:hypothetical protein